MSAAFTPGPWEYDPCITVAPDDLPCVVDQHRLVVASTLDDGKSDDECEANARLISAAPELYEALKRLRHASSGVDVLEAQDAADDALAKAVQ